MNCIYIDIASHQGTIAIVNDNKIISMHEVSDRIRDDELIPLVEDCLREAGLEYCDLNQLVCVNGPGGFTSLRVAVSFANTLIEELDIEGQGVHLSDLYAARSKAESRKLNVIWLHATKRDSLFIRGFGEYDEFWPKATLISINELIQKCPHDALWMGELLDDQKEALKELNLKEAELESIENILPKFVLGLNYDKKPLSPWYGRG